MWYIIQKGDLVPNHNYLSKIYHFFFLLLFDPEAFNMCNDPNDQ